MSGNKGNIFVKHGSKTGVYLFTQFDGMRLPKLVQKALIRGKERWGDTNSLTRILFGELVQKDTLGNTGFGISTNLSDNENFIIVIDDKLEKVGFFTEGGQRIKSYNFSQFANLPDNELEWSRVVGGARFGDYDHNVVTNRNEMFSFST